MQLQPAVHCREALRAAKIYCKIKLNGNKKSQSCISVMLASRCKNKTPKPKLRLLELWAANGYFRKRHRAVAGIPRSSTVNKTINGGVMGSCCENGTPPRLRQKPGSPRGKRLKEQKHFS